MGQILLSLKNCCLPEWPDLLRISHLRKLALEDFIPVFNPVPNSCYPSVITATSGGGREERHEIRREGLIFISC
jgi:hypothetical protein